MAASRSIQHAIAFIKAEWKQGKSLKEIARMFRVDAGNLARAFKEAEGLTVREFVSRKRIEYVNAAVIADNQYGFEIGAVLGFASDVAFYRWVKRSFGMSFARLRSGRKYKKR